MDVNRIIEGQIRECYGRVVYSHKTHEKCADILLQRHASIKFWQIFLSAITTGGLIGVFVFEAAWIAAVSAVLSTALLVLNAYTKNYDLGEMAQKRKQAANDIWLIREKYLSLLTDIAAGSHTIENVQQQRDNLLIDLHAVYGGSPSTTYAAYKQAQNALQQQQEMTFTDAEIDALLPRELRRS